MHCSCLIVVLALVFLSVSGQSGQDIKNGYYARVKGRLACRGFPIAAWALLKTAKYPTHELVSFKTSVQENGYFDMMSHAHHGGKLGWVMSPESPGFLLRIKAECGCGDNYYELPLVPESYQSRYYPEYAERNPYDYGVIELSDCSLNHHS
uniref:Transthyretin-like family protein n=1 Tax=Panagrellus redivivus TaxID=6233 RepID=A0A7E4VGR0_PANRE